MADRHHGGAPRPACRSRCVVQLVDLRNGDHVQCLRLDEGSRILWGGEGNGITGIHEWTFTDAPSGVRVTTTESFAGDPVEADTTTMQGLLNQSLKAWLERLKATAEHQQTVDPQIPVGRHICQ
jgi:hypothetical protein